MMQIIQLLYISYIFYAVAICLTKLSIIATYLRIIPQKSFQRLIYAIGAVIVALCITSVFVTVFQCTPVHSAWNFTLTERKCLPYVTFLYVSSSVNMVTDILLCLVPLPFIWRLRIPKQQRVVLCCLFGVGFM